MFIISLYRTSKHDYRKLLHNYLNDIDEHILYSNVVL